MEYLDLYDKDRQPLNKKVIRGTPLLPNEYGLAIDVWIMNTQGQFLISKRTPNKEKYPNYWECSVGGAVSAGESAFEGFMREMSEELGISPDLEKSTLIHSFIRNQNHMDLWLITDDINITSLTRQDSEVAAVQWATKKEIETLLQGDVFVPASYQTLERVINYLQK